MAVEIERMGAVRPLSADEITKWAKRLGGGGAESERRLQILVTYWFAQAGSFFRISQGTDEAQARVRDYVKRRLDQGESPDTIALPPHFHRIDKWLPELSSRLKAIHTELLDLPGAVAAALRIYGDYDEGLDHLAALAVMLEAIGRAWHGPSAGQPSLETEGNAVGLIICAVEDFTGEDFPSPRSVKRRAELELVRLLAGQLFPDSTRPQIDTMLRHFHESRLGKMQAGRPPIRKTQQ